jgi:hypothetical protein
VANPKITIQVKQNFLTRQEEITIDHEGIPAGWPVVAHIMLKAQEAAVLQAFQQLMQAQQNEIVVAKQMPENPRTGQPLILP